ncbi:MAG: arsenate reductase ArsC [bacterium JZ-2024 1]
MSEGSEGKKRPRILFVCVGNSCRSQMAEGFARKLVGDKYEVYSAGSRPAGFVAPLAIEVMKEKGIDISGQYSKGLDAIPPGPYEIVVTMGCGDDCPYVPAKTRIEWKIPDPIGCDISFYRAVRDLIEENILSLFFASK